MSDTVIWHDLECGGYDADLGLWRELAAKYGDPVVDLGAGTGRVALDLAAGGFEVLAVDVEPAFLAELDRRAAGRSVTTMTADARAFRLHAPAPLILAPMQTVQLLGGPTGRAALLAAVTANLGPTGVFAAAIAEDVEPYEAGGPDPDVTEIGGVRYESDPFGIDEDDDGYTLLRARTIIGGRTPLTGVIDRTRLDRLDAGTLETEGAAAGLRVLPRRIIEATDEHVGSTVVMLGA